MLEGCGFWGWFDIGRVNLSGVEARLYVFQRMFKSPDLYLFHILHNNMIVGCL